MSNNELKNCPFCGGKMVIKEITHREFMALCSSKPGECIAGEDGAAEETHELAIELSNKRDL